MAADSGRLPHRRIRVRHITPIGELGLPLDEDEPNFGKDGFRLGTRNVKSYGVISPNGKYIGEVDVLESRKNPGEAFILWTFINARYRNRGLGGVAYDEVENELHQSGIRRLILEPKSKRAANFWKQQGFHGETPNPPKWRSSFPAKMTKII